MTKTPNAKTDARIVLNIIERQTMSKIDEKIKKLKNQIEEIIIEDTSTKKK